MKRNEQTALVRKDTVCACGCGEVVEVLCLPHVPADSFDIFYSPDCSGE